VRNGRNWRVTCLFVSSHHDPAEEVVGSGRPFRLACYFDAGVQGGSSASLGVLLGALDPTFDVTVMGTSEPMVRSVADARPGTRTRLLSPVRSKFDMRAIAEHVRAVRAIRPDILHVNLDNPWTSQYGLLAGVLTRTPTVAVIHGRTPPWRRRQQWLVRVVARGVRAYVCVSRDSARYAESLLGLRPGSVRVIHNGTVVTAGAAPPVPAGEVRIGAVGRLSPEKGLEVLVEALRSVPQCRLVIVGEGPERATLEELVHALGLDDRVEFAGWVDPPWTATWSFDALAMPSFMEGFPLVIVEAMLAGIPVVASAVGGIPEIVVEGETGLLVAPNDAGALADALRRIADDPELREKMAARCRSVALAQFTAQTMAANFEALYRELQS
jgi:glycosyltransferase involved in cell wall biosynthesis